jgi:hypothetical protein
MLQAIEGTYKNGTIELAESPQGISESKVIVTFLQIPPPQAGQIMYFGMFAGSTQSTEEDFAIAEV